MSNVSDKILDGSKEKGPQIEVHFSEDVTTHYVRENCNLKRKTSHLEISNSEKRRQVSRSLLSQRKNLPVWNYKDRIRDALSHSKNLVIVSQTGSGKTTQIPQFLLEGLENTWKIGVTQPRRVAAVTVAQRVASEMGVEIGGKVGYSVRFDHQYSDSTRLKYLTDGMLLREVLTDPSLSKYKIIILDEAHERTVHTDVLFAFLKRLQKNQRPDLKLVIMSATLQAKQFANYFGSCEILSIPGRLFDVEILYTDRPQLDYLDSAVTTVCQIHAEKPYPGDVLVFLTGQEDIESAHALLLEKTRLIPKDLPSMNVLPFFASLPQEQQAKVFVPSKGNMRKIVLATNIAETSLTIPGIKYVVDCGLSKKRVFQPRTGMDLLVSVPISKAEAWQRAGRAGREQSGFCFRLYTESTFDGLKENIVPEILRCNLSMVALQLRAMGISSIMEFEFMNQPPIESLKHAVEEIYALGCITDENNLSNLGLQLAKLPVDPKFGRMLIAAKEKDVLQEVITIVAMISVENIFYFPKSESDRDSCDKTRKKFSSVFGDHLALLNVYQAAELAKFSYHWCRDHFIHQRSLLKAREIRQQLLKHFKIVSDSQGLLKDKKLEDAVDSIRKSLCSGLFLNTAKLQADGTYSTLLHNQTVFIHPTSCLFGLKKPEYLVYTELVLTTKQYMRGISQVEAEWLSEIAPHVFAVSSLNI